jgi:hypothetical protein
VPIPQALVSAGYEIHTIAFGYNLLRSQEAQDIVEEHRAWIREKLTSNLEHVAQQLDRDREFAYKCENPAAAVSATMNKAKLLGFMDDKSGKVPKKITIEWGEETDVT